MTASIMELQTPRATDYDPTKVRIFHFGRDLCLSFKLNIPPDKTLIRQLEYIIRPRAQVLVNKDNSVVVNLGQQPRSKIEQRRAAVQKRVNAFTLRKVVVTLDDYRQQ